MSVLKELKERWADADSPVLIQGSNKIYFHEILESATLSLSEIRQGDVVAIVGDFNAKSIATLLQLVDMKVILVPLTSDTRGQHEYFFDAAGVDVVIEDGMVTRLPKTNTHELVSKLHKQEHAGLVLFSTGTTGRPKAILHDFSVFLNRYRTPRPTLRTLSFLLFDHIGGINTLFHTLYNKGVVIAPSERTVDSILETCTEHRVEVLPTTPTFLRMLLMSGRVPDAVPSSLKIVTYGTERMDQPTLNQLCELLPNVDFRQTFGMSELGILRVKSESRNSLFMKIGGEGVRTEVTGGILKIHAENRMLGYLNAPSPFDTDGWYDTKDIVEQKGEYFKVTGRTGDVINVAGLKFMASEVERIALGFSGVELAKVIGRDNPITGQHVELTVSQTEDQVVDKAALKKFIQDHLPSHMWPRKITIGSVQVGHRFKRM